MNITIFYNNCLLQYNLYTLYRYQLSTINICCVTNSILYTSFFTITQMTNCNPVILFSLHINKHNNYKVIHYIRQYPGYYSLTWTKLSPVGLVIIKTGVGNIANTSKVSFILVLVYPPYVYRLYSLKCLSTMLYCTILTKSFVYFSIGLPSICV